MIFILSGRYLIQLLLTVAHWRSCTSVPSQHWSASLGLDMCKQRYLCSKKFIKESGPDYCLSIQSWESAAGRERQFNPYSCCQQKSSKKLSKMPQVHLLLPFTRCTWFYYEKNTAVVAAKPALWHSHFLLVCSLYKHLGSYILNIPVHYL